MSETSQTGSENEKSKTNRPPRKRQVHNEVERRRKYKINSWISKISELLPNKELHKKSKICILEQTVDYIKELVLERDKLLSEQCSDVQRNATMLPVAGLHLLESSGQEKRKYRSLKFEEVRKLKKELNLIQEQNRVYVKLLQQANISLSSLPKKATKYSNKFTEQNGLQLLQQAEQAERPPCTSSPTQEQRAIQVCSSIQDSICTSVALISATTCSQILQTPSSSSTAVLSTSVREHNNRTTAGKTLSCTSAQNISTVPVLPTCIVYTSTPVPSASAFINSQGAIPSYTNGSVFSAKTTVSVGSGGVTPALSPFPLMSTTLSSSVSDIYSKSVRMILMPSSTPIPTERVTLSNLNIASSLVHTLPISVPKTVANHCIISPLNYGNTLNVLPESALIGNGVQISTDTLPNNAVCINVANGFLNSGFIIAAPVVSSSGNSSPSVKITSQTNGHSNGNEMISTLPMACENIQSVVPSAVPLTRENCVLSNSTASQNGVTSVSQNESVTSVSQNESCANVMQPTVSDVQSEPLSKSLASATESLSSFSTKTTNSIASNSSIVHNLPDVQMEIISNPIRHHSVEPCSNVISENQLAQSENSVNLVPSSESSGCQVPETNTEAMPQTSPLSLKALCTKKIVLFSRQHQNSAGDLSQLSFPNMSSSVIHDEVVQFQSHESISGAASGLPLLSEDESKNNKNSPPATDSHIHPVPAIANATSNISLKSSPAHELLSPSLHQNRMTKPSLNVNANLATLPTPSSGCKTHNVPICSSVISDSSNTIFMLSNSSALADKLTEPQKVVAADKRSLGSSAASNSETHQDSGRNKLSSINEGISHGIISDASSTLSGQLNVSSVNNSHSTSAKPSAIELGFKHADVTPDSTSYSAVTSQCGSQMVSSASIPSIHVTCQNGTKTLTDNDHMSQSSSSMDSVKSIPCNGGIKSSQPDNVASSLYSAEPSSGQPVKRTDSEKNSVQIGESNLSALPSVFHNSQFFNPPCINIQPSSSGINIPIAPALSGNSKPNSDKSAVISSSNLSLSSLGFSALLPTHNVIPLMATPSLTAPSYCIGPNDKSCSNLLADKTGTLSFPIILSGYSDCDVIENKSIFPNMDANFSINFLNANFSSTVQKPQPSSSSKKRNKSVTKKAKCTADNKTKGCSSSDNVVNAISTDCSSKYQTLASSEVPSSDVESVELHKTSLDQPSLFLSNDILAKATESIFCNSILDGGQGPSECQEEIINSASEQSPPVDSTNSGMSEATTDTSKLDSGNESSKKNPPVVISSAENAKSACNHNSKTNEMISLENLEKESGNDTKEKTVSRIRKSSTLEDGEPMPKKAKGELNKIKDPSPIQNTQSVRQTEFYVNKLVAQETNAVKSREETVGTLENVSRESALLTVNAKDSGLQSTCNSSKSLSPSENAFPNSTPSLGEILKDVSHGMINFNPRGNVPSQGESHGLVPAEKSAVAIENSVRNTSDEFLQMPQNYFPTTSNITVPQLSSASDVPLCHSGESCKTVTNSVSAARQENQKKGNDPSQWAPKNDSSGILSYSNILKEKDPKQNCATLQPSSDSSGTTTFLYPEASNVIPTIPTSEIIPVSPSKSMSNQFCIQNVCASVTTPVIPPNINFSRGSSQVQQNFLHASPPPLLSRNYSCQNSSQTVPFSSHSSENLHSVQSMSSQSPATSSESLSHSLCSLLKDTSSQLSNMPSKNAANKNTMQTSTTAYSSAPSTSVSHSKYSALSLISHQTFSGSSSGITSSLSSLQPSVMTAPSCQQMSNTPVTTHSVCNRNTRASLSYSAENLIHSQGMEADKDKSKTLSGGYYPHKKGEQDLVQSIHDVGDSNIFMPLGSSEINTQSMSMVPLPPVTSFPSFPSNYSMCDAGPPVSLRCSGAMDRTQDLPLQLQPNEGSFLRHASMTEPTTPSHGDRHIAHSSNMTPMAKPHSNLSLSFESHGSFYNNCNFLQHPKPNLDSSAVPDNNPCFQATAFNSGYAQSIQKQNCCHFSHQAVASHSGLIADTSLPIITSVGPFHAEKNDSLMNRPSLENNSSQSCSNYIGNIFYDSSCNRQVVGTKPSSMNLSQELYSPLGVRQNTHHSAPSSGNTQNQRKNISSGKTKSKKVKQASVSENSVNTNAAVSNNTSNVNFFSVPEISCSKSNIPPVPNCYFKNSHQTPSSLQPTNDKNKLSENILSSSVPPNTFNPILHPQNDSLLNLNFQPPNFGMSSLSRPPPPLCCSCITSPVITQTFTTAATHPVPNFNLSNILPDMGCSSSESVTLSPIKFHPPSHMLPAPPPPPSVASQCQGDSSQVGSGHTLSRQGSGPSLYPPHPPVIHNTFSPLLNHASHGLNRNHAPMSGTGTSCTAPQGATFVPTQPPPFRNVIQSLNFTRSDR